MKHVLLLRFLVLFNVWWISLTVFVHASEEKSYPPSSEPETSESEFTEQRTTNEQHPPTFHTNTVVGEFPTSEGGLSSDEVTTSKKPVDDGKSFTVEATRRSSITSNEHEHSNLTTERQVNGESVSKTNKGKDTVESSSSQSLEQYEVETTNAAYPTVDKEKGVTTERSRFSVTLYEEEHSHLTTEQSERQVNSESVTKTIEFKNSFESLNTQSVGQYGAETTDTAYSTVDKEKSITTERSLSSVTPPYEEEHSILTTEWQIDRESESKFPNEGKIESSSSQSSGRSGAVTTSATDFLDESDVSGTISKQRDDADVTKSRLGTSTEEVVRQTTHSDSEAVTEEVHAKTSDASTAFTSPTSLLHSDSNVSSTISKQRDDADVTKTRPGTSTDEVVRQTTLTVSEAVTEGVHAKTSDASTAFTSPTSHLHSTSAMHFPVEDLVAPTNITSVNVTSSSVTLRWCQAGLAHNFSVTVEEVKLDDKQLNTERQCLGNISNEAMITNLEFCNWTWMSHVIDKTLEAGATYNSTIRVCNSDRCEYASHIFQTVPADPPVIKDGLIEIGMWSVNVSFVQEGVADNFNVSVSDPSAKVWWAWVSDGNKPPKTVGVFIDQLSTPGQLLTINITALSCQLKSGVQTKHINTKPSTPGSLVVFDCQDNNLCVQWNQSGVFDSYVISVNSFEANVSCLNSSVTTNNLRTVNCTVLHVIPFGSNTALLVAVRSGNQKSDEIKKIYIKVPEPPNKVTIENNSVDSLQVSVEYNYAKCQYMHFLFNISGENHNRTCTNQSHKFFPLRSNTRFDIRVYAITSYSGNNVENRISMSSRFVSGWTLPQAVSNLNVTSLTVNSLTLKWNQPDTSDNVMNNWYNVSLQSRSEYLQNITLNCSPSVLICSNQQMTYEIKNLTQSTNYTITVWAVNEGGFSDKQVITVLTMDLPVSAASAMLIGIIASAVVILILTVFILIFALRKKAKFAVPSARRPSDGLGFQNPTFTSDFGESMKPKPIPLDEFIEHLDELHNDSDLRFSAEYAMLTEMSPKHPQTASEMEENRTKNRYSNILPFDHSRVKLIPLDDDDQGSDYINASYMPGYVSKREFIAAQGPMKSTVDDFWRMIWEQHINTIVMVTNLQERGREKCAEYWPTDEEPVFYGDLQVQMKSESQLNYYIIRILEVKLGEKQRVVKHLHFISWPDFGCPENTAVLLDFVLGVRAHAPSQPLQGSGPILVHCSAGVGRTGTFILVDHLLQRMRQHRTLDIFGLVLEMRNYRCNMLQTEAQYVFAHECIKTAIERQMISSIRSSNAEDEDGECLYQNVSKKDEDGECMYQNVTRKDKIEEEEECLYENCTKENMERPPV